MTIFVDGFQNTGKTSLIEACGYPHDRFPFNQYMDSIGIEDINGYQLGKDLGIMFALERSEEHLVLDRGPISTVFYSLKEKRYGEETEKAMLAFLREIAKRKGFGYVFVMKSNGGGTPLRKHDDGFDYLDDENDENKDSILGKTIDLALEAGIYVHIFENDFSRSLEENAERFEELMKEIFDEHD